MMMNQRKKQIFVLLMICILGGSMIFAGCGGSSTGPEKEFFDPVSGIMLVRAEKTTNIYSDWPIPEGDDPEIKTEIINFIFVLKLSREIEGQVRIYGLEGADVGKYDHRVYPDCINPNDCKVYGTMSDNTNLEVDLENNGRTYVATGSIQTMDFNIQAEYQHENVVIQYDLTGERIF